MNRTGIAGLVCIRQMAKELLKPYRLASGGGQFISVCLPQ